MAMTGIQFRRAVMADADLIRDCIARAYARASRDIPDLPDVTDGVEGDIERRQVVVATMDDAIAGVIMFGMADDAVMIFNLAVVPEAQGAGLARKLMQFAEDEALKQRCGTLRLRTHRFLHGTRAMYHHLGWAECEESGNTITMQKSVGRPD